MTACIHDDEFDTSESVVRALLREQGPHWADHELTLLDGTGTSNALWRIDDRTGAPVALVRLPRTPGAVSSVTAEAAVLPALAASTLPSVVQIPGLLHTGQPSGAFPEPWLVTNWIDGTDAWEARATVDEAGPALAHDLAAVVRAISELHDVPAPDRPAGRRGGPLAPLLEMLDRWLTDPQWQAAAHLDVRAIRRLTDEARELVDDPTPHGFVHGDLIPGNLLLGGTHLAAVIDWGGAGYGDPAQDLDPAWAVFDQPARAVFREILEVDEPTWIRARAFALEHAVGGTLYYRPRRHPLGDVMARSLERILAER